MLDNGKVKPKDFIYNESITTVIAIVNKYLFKHISISIYASIGPKLRSFWQNMNKNTIVLFQAQLNNLKASKTKMVILFGE